MAEEGALAERALTTAWDAFEERFSWEDVSDLRLLGRLCLCSRALATVNAVRGPSPLLGRITIAEEDVRFAILFALREVFRQLLKRGCIEGLRTAVAAADPAVLRSRAVLIRLTLALGNLSIEARLRVAFRSSPLLEVEEGIGHLLGYPLWMIRSPLGWKLEPGVTSARIRISSSSIRAPERGAGRSSSSPRLAGLVRRSRLRR